MTKLCMLCEEPLLRGEQTRPANSVQWMHAECGLRSALGGIGHLLAHEYWCDQHHDPDAGLTFRQSALMVDQLVSMLGVEGTLERATF